jgi:hypothetical protein
MSLLTKASTVTTPTAYGDGVLNSVKPTDGDGDFDFARASSATRVNEQGYIEKERENLLLQSNTFSNASWNKIRSSVTSGVADPFGGSNAWSFLTDNTADNQHYISQVISQSGVGTLSIYAKPNGYNWLRMRLPSEEAYFDLANGVTGSSTSGISASMTDVGSGWYRCEVAISDMSTNPNVFIHIAEGDGDIIINGTPSGTDGVYIYAAQLEQGLVATDYIETTTSSVAVGITNDIPRINYEGGIGNFLLEPQRTNLITQSEYFGAWNEQGTASVTDNQAISPEGVQNAALLDLGATSGGFNRIDINASISAGIDYVFSVFVKNIDVDNITISNFESGNYQIANFDLVNGLNRSIESSFIEDYGNNWWRIAFVLNTNTATTANLRIQPSLNASYPSQGEQFYIYGATLEEGSYATSYIPSFGSAVTRAAETCNNAGNSDLFNDSEGVLYVEIAALVDDLTQRHISISDGTIVNVVRIHYHTSSNSIRGQVRAGGSIQASLTHIVPDIKDFHKVAISYKENDVKLYVDGVLVLTDTSASMPTGLDELSFDRGDASLEFYGKTKMVSTFTEALSDSELECLTSWSSFNRMATAQNYTIE